MNHKFNNQLGSRSIRHKNLLIAPGQGIVEFRGESIAPVCRVTATGFSKGGKWSYTEWTVELRGALPLVWAQDWGSGEWFRATGLAGAVEELAAWLPEGHGLTNNQIERAILAIWPNTAAKLAEADKAWTAAGDQLADLLAAQEEHAAALAAAGQVVATLEATEEAKRLRDQAAKLTQAAAQAKGGKLSLADLKAMMAA